MSNTSQRRSSQTRRSSFPNSTGRKSSILASLVDGAEGRQSERSRQSIADLDRDFGRASLRPSTSTDLHHEEPIPQLSEEDVEQLLENCTKFAQNKQINEGRLWDLALPRHMPELAKRNTHHTNFNFQKVMFGLDASVQIYSRRVDSIHNSALDARCRLAEKSTATTVEEEETVAPRRQNRQTNFEGDSTIVTSLDQITSKSNNEDLIPIDPLFQKTSALFDAGGFKGLPTLNRGLSYGGRYILDKNEAPNGDLKLTCDLPPMHVLNLEAFGTAFDTLIERRPISESSLKLCSMLGHEDQSHLTRDLIARGKDSIILKPQTPGFREDVEGPEENGVEDFEMDVDGDVEIQMEQDFDEAEEFPLEANHSEGEFNPPPDLNSHELRLSFEVTDSLNVPHDTDEVEVLDEATIGWLLDVSHDQGANRGRAWIGSVHWKYPKASRVNLEEDNNPQPRKKPNKREIDWTKLPETDVVLFKKPVKESSNSMLFKEDAETLLPADHKFDSSVLLSSSVFLGLKPRNWIGRWLRQTQREPIMDQEMQEFGDFEDGGFDLEDEDEFGSFEAPQQIEEGRVDFDFIPSKVNMHQLKSDLWSRIEDMGRTQTEIPFSAFVDNVMQNGDVSIGLCFSGSLHLAAERGFHIINKTPLEISILLHSEGPEDPR